MVPTGSLTAKFDNKSLELFLSLPLHSKKFLTLLLSKLLKVCEFFELRY